MNLFEGNELLRLTLAFLCLMIFWILMVIPHTIYQNWRKLRPFTFSDLFQSSLMQWISPPGFGRPIDPSINQVAIWFRQPLSSALLSICVRSQSSCVRISTDYTFPFLMNPVFLNYSLRKMRSSCEYFDQNIDLKTKTLLISNIFGIDFFQDKGCFSLIISHNH